MSLLEKEEGSSLSLFKREKKTRESSKRMIDDDVLKSYDLVQDAKAIS